MKKRQSDVRHQDHQGAAAVIESKGLGTTRHFRKQGAIFEQGSDCDTVLYLQEGRIKLSVRSHAGREAVVALLEPGDFFGEGCLSGQSRRISSAWATTACVIVEIAKADMVTLLHSDAGFSEKFLAQMLSRTIRIEADLVAHLFNGAEKRLARTLLLLARYNNAVPLATTVPAISPQSLAAMVGTTPSRVNFFMNKFRRLGFIDYKDGITVNRSLLTVVLHD